MRAQTGERAHPARTCSSLLAAILHAAAVLAGSAPATAAPGAAEPVELTPGRPVTASLAGGEGRSYVFRLEAGRFARVEVEQRGIDVVAILTSPNGTTLVEADGPDGPEGIETVSALAQNAAEAGLYRLEVRCGYPDSPAGEISVVLAEERPAEPDDPDRLAAERITYEAVKLWGQGGAESLHGAIERFEQVLGLRGRLGEKRREAEVATHLGYLYGSVGELTREAEYFERALVAWRQLGETAREAELLNNLGTTYGRQGDAERGLAATTAALELFRRLGDRLGEASALNSLGHAQIRTGASLDRAEESFQHALRLSREIGNAASEGRSLANIARVRLRRGDLGGALEAYRTALELARTTGDARGEAAALNNVSATLWSMGELARALDHYLEVLNLVRELGDSRGEAYALNNLGTLYVTLGEGERGIDYLRQALEHFERIGDRWAEAGALDAIGWAYIALDRPDEALGYVERGLQVARDLGDSRREALALANLVYARLALGQAPIALPLAEQAVKAAREGGVRTAEAYALSGLGKVHLALGAPRVALEVLSEALRISRETGARPSEAMNLLDMARAKRALERFDEARHDLVAALDLVESVRTAVAAPDLRATYLASKQEYYEEWISLLMELHHREPGKGWDAIALGVAERARARTLLEVLTGAEDEIRSDLEPSLAAEEERLRYLLNAQERARHEAVAAGDAAAAAEAVGEIRALFDEYRALESRIRSSNPRYADLVTPQPLDAAEIQSTVLDRDTMMLEYSLGEQASWLWAVTHDSLATFQLAPRAEIEARARKVYDLLTARNLEPDGEDPTARARRLETADRELPGALAALADAVLGPVASRLALGESRRLVVVADAALHYVPFAALSVPGTGQDQPLLFSHEVVNVPSASALAVLRKELEGRGRVPGTLAVIADPVFSAADPRVPSDGERLAAGGADGAGLRAGTFRRLRFTAHEAEEIASLVPESARLTALGFDASRDLATSGRLADYRMVHFATHGVLNTDYPALSGLVLSQVGRHGEPREGFLRLHDIYGLDLHADLVTLSACETALGREIRGEGLVGLARGFMYAGSARVVASLWSVQDRATAETMRRFYQGVLASDLTPAAALREAQIAMARQERWASPYFWAPFVLYGEWR